MLTKDLVQATVRSGKLFPKFIKPGDAKALAEAGSLCELFSSAKGRVVGDLEEDVKAIANTPRGRAFAKILLDDCDVKDPGAEVLDRRWQIFLAAEKLRVSTGSSFEEFKDKIAKQFAETPEQLSQRLFADLPSARTVENIPELSSKDLIERFNLSHVTTFLCFADDVTVSLSNLTLAQKRELMRRLKFHRLMSDVEVDKESSSIRLELSGPLKIFGKTQGYAVRIANFFPFVSSMPEWRLEARVSWKGKKVVLSLDQDCGVSTRSTRAHGSYVPPEFQQVIASLNETADLEVLPGEDFIHIGKQSYCFPDFMVKVGGVVKGVELFHSWHKGQAKHRIETAEKAKTSCLLIGIDRSLMKDPELKSICEKSAWFEKYGFEFSQFPTPGVIRRAVMRHD